MSPTNPMKTEERKQRLHDNGCSPDNSSIGPGGSDVSCLEQEAGIWRVFYTERGKAKAPIFESSSEAEACEFTSITLRRKSATIIWWDSLFRNRMQSDWSGNWLRMGSNPIGIKFPTVAGAIRVIASLWSGRVFSRRGPFWGMCS